MAKFLTLPGWLYPVPGLFVQVFGLFSGDVEMALGGSALLCIGLALYARGKGYNPAWGLWGTLPVLGALVILAQPDRRTVPGARMRGGVPLLSLMTVVGLAANVVVPQVVGGDYFWRQPPMPQTPPPVAAVEVEPPPPPPQPEPQPEPAPPEPSPPAAPTTFEEAYGRIKIGMTVDEVRQLAGEDMLVVHKSDDGLSIIRWESETHSFTARFTGGKLDKLSKLQKRVVHLSAEAQEELRARSQQRVDARPEPPSYNLPEETQTEEPAQPSPALEEPIPDAAEQQPAPKPSGVVTQRGRREQVVRVGRQDGERKPRPAVKKARLPRYSGTISRGPHDVVFINRGESVLRVGIRLNQRGLDFDVRPGDYRVIFVSNGTYGIHYIDSAEPETLHTAGSVTVDTPPTAIRVELPR